MSEQKEKENVYTLVTKAINRDTAGTILDFLGFEVRQRLTFTRPDYVANLWRLHIRFRLFDEFDEEGNVIPIVYRSGLKINFSKVWQWQEENHL